MPGLWLAHENRSVAASVSASLKRIKMLFQKQADTARGGTLLAKRHVLSLYSPRASSVPVARPTLVSFRRTHRQALQRRRRSVGCDKGAVEEMVLILRFLVFFFFFFLLLLKNSASRALRCGRAGGGAQPAREGPRSAASRPPSRCCPFLAPSRWRPGEEARSPAAGRERAGTGGRGPSGAAASPPQGGEGRGPLPRVRGTGVGGEERWRAGAGGHGGGGASSPSESGAWAR